MMLGIKYRNKKLGEWLSSRKDNAIEPSRKRDSIRKRGNIHDFILKRDIKIQSLKVKMWKSKYKPTEIQALISFKKIYSIPYL